MMQKSEATEIQIQNQGIFEPVMSLDAAVAAFRQITVVCDKLLTKEDYAMLKVRRRDDNGNWIEEKKPFRKKSGWDKMSMFWGVSTDPPKIERFEIPGTDTFGYKVSVRAYKKLPNGLEYSKTKSAIVTSAEKEKTEKMKESPRKEHDVMSAAETRAYGRAMSSFFGLGELTAEEIEDNAEDIPANTKRACKCSDATKKVNSKKLDGTCPVCNGVRF